MADSYQVRRTRLTTPDANRLSKWVSVWADLRYAGMALHERLQLEVVPATGFVRRAFWDAAVACYGRMDASNKKRKVGHEALLRTARGERGLEFHAEIMEWRNGHVAHRFSRDFEAVRVFADHLDAEPTVLDSIRAEVATSIGPPIGSELECEFQEHVEAVANTLWEQYLAPIAERLVELTPPGQPMREPWESAPDAAERMILEACLWSRANGTGSARPTP